MINPIPKKPWLSTMRNQWYCDYCDTPIDLTGIQTTQEVHDEYVPFGAVRPRPEGTTVHGTSDSDFNALYFHNLINKHVKQYHEEDPYEKMVKESPWCYAHGCNNDWCRCK